MDRVDRKDNACGFYDVSPNAPAFLSCSTWLPFESLIVETPGFALNWPAATHAEWSAWPVDIGLSGFERMPVAPLTQETASLFGLLQ